MTIRRVSALDRPQWSNDDEMLQTASSSTSQEQQALPSSFIMSDGTDWSSHIGMFFGNPPRRHSSIDFNMLDARNEHSQGIAYQSQTDLAHLSLSNSEPKGHQGYMGDIASDTITLQDVINSTEDDFTLPEHEDPWTFMDKSGLQQAGGLVSSHQFRPIQPPTMPSMNDEVYAAENSADRDFSESLESTEGVEPCYARLLWRCLLDAPGHTLSLKDIYTWIKDHTSKARDPKNKGWQNSVRHNLSMNAAFEKVSIALSGESKTRSLWRLTDNAARDGVISTTRYRRDPKRKQERRGQPALKRQLSGARGGAATRASLQYKRLREARERNQYMPQAMQQHYCIAVPEHTTGAMLQQPGHMLMQQPLSPYYQSPAIIQTSATSSPYPQPIDQFNSGTMDRSCFQSFELGDLQPHTGLFNNVDLDRSGTPSSLTDSSLFTEDTAYGQMNSSLAGQF